MSGEIPYINQSFLSPAILHTFIYPDLDHDYYWSDCWSAQFYRDLARAGFIPIANNRHGVLIPEMQKSYAVLDWNDLHVSRHARKIIRSSRLADDAIYLAVEKDTDAVVKGIRNAYGSSCWLGEPYARLLRELGSHSGDGFSLVAVELRSEKRQLLFGGELGYTVGATYTSLSGFLDRVSPHTSDMGTIQLLALARLLERCGYAFWNLGQPFMKYKTDLGAKVTPRLAFLQRFLPAGGKRPKVDLARTAGSRTWCRELLAPPG